jgi:hypothetical protein
MLFLGVVAGAASPSLSAGISLVVAALALVMAIVAFRAGARRRNRALHVVGAAFVVFTAKNIFSAVNVLTHLVPHDSIELVLSLFDLVLLLMLFAPFLRRRRS